MIPVKCKMYLKLAMATLAGGAQWIEHWPANWKVTSSVPGQGTCLGLWARNPAGGV